MADQQVEQTNISKPWAPLGDQLNKIYATAQNLHNFDIGFHPYTGPTQAALDPYTKQSQNIVAQLATSPNQMVDGAGNNISYYASGGEMAGGMPEHLKGILDYNANLVGGQTAGMASGAGRYGSRSHANTTAQGIAAANNPYIFNWANQAANRSLQAGAMVPMMNEMKYDGATRLAGLGDFNMGREQQRLDTARQLWEQQDNAPWQRLGAYSGVVGGMNPGGGSSTGKTSTTQPGMTGMQGLLGGAMAGASLGSMFGPIGTGVGGVLGGIGGGLLGSW